VGFETKAPPKLIYRVARLPDPWEPPDWSRARPEDGTFGNRFDDPEGYYRVLYASSQQVGCFLETLARFRVGLKELAAAKGIRGDDDFTPSGKVPPGWHENRTIGTARADGNYADICGSEWLAYLRQKLASDCLELGLNEFDASLLQSGRPRRITQLASRIVFELGYPGIYYRSRYGHDIDNWALFERFRIRDTSSQAIAKSHPALIEAARILGIET
jgi:hypothetical protein